MNDSGDKSRRGGERGPLPRTNRPRQGAQRRSETEERAKADVQPETKRDADVQARAEKSTAKSLDVHAETEAAPPTVRQGDRSGPQHVLEDGATLAERPTQLDTGGASVATSTSPRLTPKLKQVPLVRADGTRAIDDALPSSTYVGCTIDDRYRIEGVLGRGGMGVVYRGRHDVIDKLVAIKILLPTEDADVVDRFVMEARAATAIGNAHIVDTVDFGKLPDGSTYFVMEYLEGQTLAKKIKSEGFVPLPRAIAIAKEIAEGMGAAHRAGIVHRDLKPENIFLVERDGQADFVKLLDFGIAKVESSQNRITRAGTIFGTPHYMSPEQAAGREVDARTDIYAAGVILYEMLSGRTPFDAENPMGLLTQHLYTEPTPLERLSSPRQDVPSGLDAIVLKCLGKNPADRYASMADFVEDLERVERQEPPKALADLLARAEREDDSVMMAAAKAELRKTPPRAGRHVVIGALGVVLLAFGAFAAFSLRSPDIDPTPVGPSATVPAARVEAPAITGRSVALVFSPIDAEVFRDGRSLGGMPVTVHLADGEVAAVEIRRDGFYPETMRLDGSRPVVVVRLNAIPGVQPRVPVPTGEPLDALRKADGGARALAAMKAMGVMAGHHDAGAPLVKPHPAGDGGAPRQPRVEAPTPAASVAAPSPEIPAPVVPPPVAPPPSAARPPDPAPPKAEVPPAGPAPPASGTAPP